MTAVRPGAPAPRCASGWPGPGLELRLFYREPAQVIFSFAYPILMMLIFASVFRNDTVAGGVTYTQYFLSGIAATGIMLGSFQALGIRIALERDDGELARLQALGTPPVSYFFGKAAQVVVTTAAQLAVLLVVGALPRSTCAMPVDAAHWLTFAWVAVLGALAGTVLGHRGIAAAPAAAARRTPSSRRSPSSCSSSPASSSSTAGCRPGCGTSRRRLPAEMADARDALGVPAGRGEARRGGRFVAARHDRARPAGVGCDRRAWSARAASAGAVRPEPGSRRSGCRE